MQNTRYIIRNARIDWWSNEFYACMNDADSLFHMWKKSLDTQLLFEIDFLDSFYGFVDNPFASMFEILF